MFSRHIRQRCECVFQDQAARSIGRGKIDGDSTAQPSPSWRMTEHLIKHGRIGCVPGVDFGPNGEGYVRFCFARDRKELVGALQSMKQLFGVAAVQ